MTRRLVFTIFGGLMLALTIGLFAIFGSEGKNDDYQPQNEFKLDPWISIKIGALDMSINKAVLYIFLAAALTIGDDGLHRQAHAERPNRVQTAVEAPTTSRDNITGSNMDRRDGEASGSRSSATLFFFIWFSNMIGYIPLPTNTEHTFNIFGAGDPGASRSTPRPRTSRSRSC